MYSFSTGLVLLPGQDNTISQYIVNKSLKHFGQAHYLKKDFKINWQLGSRFRQVFKIFSYAELTKHVIFAYHIEC